MKKLLKNILYPLIPGSLIYNGHQADKLKNESGDLEKRADKIKYDKSTEILTKLNNLQSPSEITQEYTSEPKNEDVRYGLKEKIENAFDRNAHLIFGGLAELISIPTCIWSFELIKTGNIRDGVIGGVVGILIREDFYNTVINQIRRLQRTINDGKATLGSLQLYT